MSGDHHEIFERSARRYQVLSCRKPRHLLLRGEANANANGRDVIQPFDLPITKGLQESIHGYRRINDEELEPILRELTQLQPLDLAYGEETDAKLPEILGGLSYALARSFKILNPGVKNPNSAHWETAFQLFNLLL